jgi:multidrug transporter EmrE-like cation transporter
MSMRGAILVMLSALVTVCANLILRSGLLRAGGLRFNGEWAPQLIAICREPRVAIGFLLYAIGAVLWFGVISVENLSTAYPALVGLTFVMVTIGAVLVFGEKISAQKIVGAIVILLGVLVVARS